jgi:predicted nucleic acid-binding protein
MKNVFIDSDVILDFLFDRKPFSGHSAQILDMCYTQQLSGHITAVILANIYYLLRKTTTHDNVILHLKKLLQILEVVTTDKKTILDALESNFSDFEDALQNFSAQNSNNIEIIITRNINDYKKSKLVVITPENFLKTIS